MEKPSLSRKSSSFGARLERFSSRPSAVLTIEPCREVQESSDSAPAQDQQISSQLSLEDQIDGSSATDPLLGNEVMPEEQITGPTTSSSSSLKDQLDRKMDFAFNASLVVNVLLFAVKIYAYVASRSKSVLASCADSLVDIASQLVRLGCHAVVMFHSPHVCSYRCNWQRNTVMLLCLEQVLALADYKVAKADPKFPVGRSRLEAVGESVCFHIGDEDTLR